jgi:cytochrome c2
MQAAVWMQSDKITYAHMAQKFSISEEDWSAGQAVFQECQGPAQAGSQSPN